MNECPPKRDHFKRNVSGDMLVFWGGILIFIFWLAGQKSRPPSPQPFGSWLFWGYWTSRSARFWHLDLKGERCVEIYFPPLKTHALESENDLTSNKFGSILPIFVVHRQKKPHHFQVSHFHSILFEILGSKTWMFCGFYHRIKKTKAIQSKPQLPWWKPWMFFCFLCDVCFTEKSPWQITIIFHHHFGRIFWVHLFPSIEWPSANPRKVDVERKNSHSSSHLPRWRRSFAMLWLNCLRSLPGSAQVVGIEVHCASS